MFAKYKITEIFFLLLKMNVIYYSFEYSQNTTSHKEVQRNNNYSTDVFSSLAFATVGAKQNSCALFQYLRNSCLMLAISVVGADEPLSLLVDIKKWPKYQLRLKG